MGTGNLPNVTNPVIELDHINDIRNAMRIDFVGRNSAGAATAGQNLGTAGIPWGYAYMNQLVVGGRVIDFDNIGATNSNNAVISGQTRTGSGQPDFLRAAGSGGGASFDILGDTTSLIYTANGTSATISTDVTVSALTVAPSSNNTCLVNDTAYTDQNSTKYEGEGSGSITIDTAGSEITNRIGQYVALKGANEIMLAYVESATKLRNCFRGFFFDDSGAPIVRETLANNDVLTLMSLGWVFAEDNGTTIDISYRSPYVQHTEPTSPATDDYWFSTSAGVWKRYDGANFITIDRTLIGLCVVNTADCIATRSLDFSKAFNDFIAIEVELESTTKVRASLGRSSISVYSNTLEFFNDPVQWDMTADLETGLSEAADTLYYLYVTEQGETIISDERPYNRMADLKGFYHPYHTWRYVGVAYNDGSSNLTSANSKNNYQAKVQVFTASGEFLPLPNVDNLKVIVVGGGGGGDGGGSTPTGGGTSSFGSYVSCTGGSAGEGGVDGSSGGTATGGDINVNGERGGGAIKSDNGSNTYILGKGGGSLFGHGGSGALRSADFAEYSGSAGIGYGAGGGGKYSGSNLSGGGGGGATGIKYISNASARVAVTVGAGGSGGSGGNVGTAGIVIVEY